MPWFRSDDGFHVHPKSVGLSFAAEGLWHRAGCWCAQQLTDGAIPRHLVDSWHAPGELPTELVDRGLWEETATGWQVHDYLDYNPSRAQILERKESDRARKGHKPPPKPPPNGFHAESERIPITPGPGPGPVSLSSENSQILSTAAASSSRGREAPPELQQFGDFTVVGRVRDGYAKRLAEKTGQAMPQTRWANEAIATIAAWVSETAGIRGCDPCELSDQLLEAYFASSSGAEARFKAITLAGDPARYLDPPPQAAGSVYAIARARCQAAERAYNQAHREKRPPDECKRLLAEWQAIAQTLTKPEVANVGT